MENKRLDYLWKATTLYPQSAMAHAALGLLLSRDCSNKISLNAGNCKKGILSLLKAKKLAPELAFPAYALINRANYPHFPKSLRPLLKDSPATICDKFKNSVPDWDWAFHSVCGVEALKTDKKKAMKHARRVSEIPIIRPADILLGYLKMELSQK